MKLVFLIAVHVLCRVRLLDRDLPPVTPSFRGDLKPIKGRVCLQGNSPLDTSEMPVLFRPVDGVLSLPHATAVACLIRVVVVAVALSKDL